MTWWEEKTSVDGRRKEVISELDFEHGKVNHTMIWERMLQVKGRVKVRE